MQEGAMFPWKALPIRSPRGRSPMTDHAQRRITVLILLAGTWFLAGMNVWQSRRYYNLLHSTRDLIAADARLKQADDELRQSADTLRGTNENLERSCGELSAACIKTDLLLKRENALVVDLSKRAEACYQRWTR